MRHHAFISRFKALEKKRRQRRWFVFMALVALVLYGGACLLHYSRPAQIAPPNPAVLSRPTGQIGQYAPPRALSRRTGFIVRSVAQHSAIEHRRHINAPQAQQVFSTSSATVHSIGSGGYTSSIGSSASNDAPQHSAGSPFGFVYPALSFAPALAKTFTAATEQTAARKAGRRSGFVDDPDPQTPADPLATDPFMDDPEPFDPADPLANDTPLGDALLPLLLLCLVFTLIRKRRRA